MTTIRPTLAVCMVTAAVTAAGLFLPGGDGEAPTAYGANEAPSVQIQDFAFSGLEPLPPGAVIDVANLDAVGHTLTSTDQLFDTGVLEAGDSAQITAPDGPGTYRFFCEIHPSMTGSLTVSDGTAPDATVVETESPDPTTAGTESPDDTAPEDTAAEDTAVEESAPDPTTAAAPTTTAYGADTAPAAAEQPATTVAPAAAAAAPGPTTTLAPLPETTAAAPAPETTVAEPVSPDATNP